METAEIKDVITKACELVADVPCELRPVAFCKAFELLALSPSANPVAKNKDVRREQNVTIAAPKNNKKSSSSGRQKGPKGLLETILEEDFFEQDRSVAEMQDELKHHKGRSFSSRELSVSALRLVREGKLQRRPISDGQYQYRASK